MTLSRNIASLIIKKNLKIEDVISTLTTYNLLSLLPAIKDAVVKITRDDGKENSIRIESPFEVGSAALAKIRRIAGNDLAPTEVTINKDVLAGFKARYKGKLYDGSMQRIMKEFIKN